MYDDLQAVTEYFGEDFAPADATRLLRTVRDFVVLFEKGMADIKVRRRGGRGRRQQACPPLRTAMEGRRLPLAGPAQACQVLRVAVRHVVWQTDPRLWPCTAGA